jgi:hypothetical protein
MSSISGIGGDIINILQISGQTYYNINGGSNTVISAWPVTINNTNTAGGFVKVLFTDITLSSNTEYFICGTDYIELGNMSLNPNGTRPIITIDSVAGYPGLIQNGTDSIIGKNYINIFNLIVDGTNSTLDDGGGWIGQAYFANSSDKNFIVYCSSNGDISSSSGGITGTYFAVNGIEILIEDCTSSGNMINGAGGIVGADSYSNFAGGSAISGVGSCSSSGIIGTDCGGICGSFCGSNGTDNFEISNCCSTGQINGGGGICGANAGDAGNIDIRWSHSLGTIISGGGIFGDNAGSNGGTATVYNSYVLGNTLSGINPNIVDTNCYIVNGSWSDITANSILLLVGETWLSLEINTPYILYHTGCTPYELDIISVAINGYDIDFVYISIIEVGSSTIGTVQPGYVLFRILDGGDSSITINSVTGAITGMEPGYYELIIYGEFADGIYSTTLLGLFVEVAPINPSVSEPPCCEINNCIINPQTSDYDASLITNKKQDKIIVREADQIFANVAAGRQVNPMPVFRTYYDYMNYLRGKARY